MSAVGGFGKFKNLGMEETDFVVENVREVAEGLDFETLCLALGSALGGRTFLLEGEGFVNVGKTGGGIWGLKRTQIIIYHSFIPSP